MFCNANWFVLFNPSKIYRIPETNCQKCHGSSCALSIFLCCLPSCVSDSLWVPLQSPDHLALLLTSIQSTHPLWYNSPALPWCRHQIVSSPTVIVGASPTDSVICSDLLRLIHLLSTTASASPMASTINPTNTGIRSHSAQYSFVNKTLITFPSSLSAFGSWMKSVSNRNKTAGRKKKESCCPLALWAWGLLKVWRGRFHIQCSQRVNTLQHWRSWIICGGCYLVLWRQICFCLKWIIMLGRAVYSVPCHRLFIVITLCSLLEDGSGFLCSKYRSPGILGGQKTTWIF